MQKKYLGWPIIKKKATCMQISQLVYASNHPLLCKPIIISHKGNPLGSKSHNTINLTSENPSLFKMVKKTRKCNSCKRFGYNGRTCKHKVESFTSNQ